MFETPNDATSHQVVIGLNKIGLALKSQAWQQAGLRRLTPTQGQILVILRGRARSSMRLEDVAKELGVSAATACDAVAALSRKGMIKKAPRTDDPRAITLTLTAKGHREANLVATWPDFLLETVETLSQPEQEMFLRVLIKMIKRLQDRRAIQVSRMCITCRYFRPYAHAGTSKPHHCAFVNASFGDRHLRLDCPDHIVANADVAEKSWQQWRGKEVRG